MKRMKYRVKEQGGDPNNNPEYDVHLTDKLVRIFIREAGIAPAIGDPLPYFVPELGLDILDVYEWDGEMPEVVELKAS